MGIRLPFRMLCTVSVQIPQYIYIATIHPSVAEEVGNSCTLSLPPELVESPASGDIPSSRQWDLVGVADSSQLGTAKRTRELDKLRQRRTEHGMYMFDWMNSAQAVQTPVAIASWSVLV